MKVEPNLDGAEGEGEDLEDLLVRREASAGAGEERRRVEQRPATFLLNFPIFDNVTRYGKISPLWQKYTSIWLILDNLFLIWQNHQNQLYLDFPQKKFYITSAPKIISKISKIVFKDLL